MTAGQVATPVPEAVELGTGESQHSFRDILSKVPLIVRVAVLHLLRRTPQSKYLDLRTELTIAVVKAFADPSPPVSITAIQKMAAKAPPLKGRIWVSTYACALPPPGETGMQDAIAAAIAGLRDPQLAEPEYQMPDPIPVEGEWTGYRAAAGPDARLPDLPQRELYAELMKEVKSPATILYFHGGAYYMMDPATHRPTTKKLAKMTGGRVYSVRYRLTPQHPFPAALMDALMSYLALLYPPEGAFHEPVKPEQIVFAGDSAGGHLSLCLIQVILHLHRQNNNAAPEITWHGQRRPLPLPAGVAVNSPWTDITHSSPSCTTNAAFDYLPTLAQQLAADAARPPCAAWPASPPRKHLFAPDSLLTHPLVSLVLARDWAGCPPVYVCTGWELLADEDRFLAARRLRAAAGVRVVLEVYEAMPHCFALLFPQLREARRCLEGWAGFVKRVAEGGAEAVESRCVTVKARTLEEVEEAWEAVCGDADEVVEERVWRTARERGFPEECIAKL